MLIMSALGSSAVAAQFEEIKRSDITIRYEQGLKTAVLEVFGSIPSIKEQIKKRTGLEADFPFEVIIYRNRNDFVRLARNDMIAAFAVPEEYLVVLDLSQMRVHPLNIELITMHEMTHLVLHHYIKRDNMPKWFDEGVSEWVSGISEIINPEKTDVLKRAAIGRKLLPFYLISDRFPVDPIGFRLAYEQSRSMVEYLESEYGEGSVQGIILRMRKGVHFNDAVTQELNVAFEKIEQMWKKDIKVQYTWFGYVSNNIHWIVLSAAAFITILGFIRLRIRMRSYKDEEEEIEPF